MTEHQGLPVAGYAPQSDEKVQIVNGFKADEERLLRKLDALFNENMDDKYDDTELPYDSRWIAIAKTGFEQAFMALNRGIFKPKRIKLPEDYPSQVPAA